MMKFILIITILLQSSLAFSYFIDRGRLHDDNGDYLHWDNVKDISLNFHHQQHGYILLNTGQLYLVWQRNGVLESREEPISYQTSEISFPYFISHDDLYYFNPFEQRMMRVLYNVKDLCRNYVKKRTHPDAFPVVYKFHMNNYIEVRAEQYPRKCY